MNVVLMYTSVARSCIISKQHSVDITLHTEGTVCCFTPVLPQRHKAGDVRKTALMLLVVEKFLLRDFNLWDHLHMKNAIDHTSITQCMISFGSRLP